MVDDVETEEVKKPEIEGINIDQDFSDLEKNLAMFAMDKRPEVEDDEDDYPQRGFSFAP